MRLTWQLGYTQSRRPVRRVNTRRSRRGVSGEEHGPQQFEFVIEYPYEHQRTRRSPSVSVVKYSNTSADPTTSLPADSDRGTTDPEYSDPVGSKELASSDKQTAYSHAALAEEEHTFSETPHWTSGDGSLLETGDVDNSTACETPELSQDHPGNEHKCDGSRPHDQESDVQPPNINKDSNNPYTIREKSVEFEKDVEPDLASCQAVTANPVPISIPPSVLYDSLWQKFNPILIRYNEEFCEIPTTTSLRTNPFRCRTDLNFEPMFLIHAVMALAGHHLGSTSVQDHRHTSLRLLSQSLDTTDLMSLSSSMLDTIVILFSLDETQSAFGNWTTHLSGAYSILECCGGIEIWTKSTRIVAQVGMLMWWDAILSIVSREDCVFPYEYFDTILHNYDDKQWDYFGLCGCPLGLVKMVMRLARLNAEKRKSSSMRYVRTDCSEVGEIERSLKLWQHRSDTITPQNERHMQQDRDKMHCSEAWRNGLLIYLYRVFRWQPGTPVPMKNLTRARTVIDHVIACREESMMSRQALLPLFFAGCEMRDESLRRRILMLCTFWNDKTKYHMFSSTIPLLRDVWANQEVDGFDNVWWGQAVDQRHVSELQYPLQMRICFG